MNILKRALLGATALTMVAAGGFAETLTIATVNNGDMVRMQKLAGDFTTKNPDIQLEWVDAGRKRPASARHDRHRHQGRSVRRDDHRHLRSSDLGQARLAGLAERSAAKAMTSTIFCPPFAAA